MPDGNIKKSLQIDAFTTEKYKGNPAGVVLNTTDLSPQEMQLIARELNNSETAFVLDPKEGTNAYDYEVRYFTPTTEVPICGHATIGALYAKAIEDNLHSCIIRIKTQVGILPIEIEKLAADYRITMTQGAFSLGPVMDLDIQQQILRALGLQQEDLADNCPMQIASTGHSKVMIGIDNRDKLNALKPDFKALSALSAVICCNGYFVFTRDSDQAGILTYGRMFAPAIGIDEDPVTGNANGPLGGYLVEHNLVLHNGEQYEFTAAQGEKINRLGTVDVRVTIHNDKPQKIQISGNAVPIFRTSLF